MGRNPRTCRADTNREPIRTAERKGCRYCSGARQTGYFKLLNLICEKMITEPKRL